MNKEAVIAIATVRIMATVVQRDNDLRRGD